MMKNITPTPKDQVIIQLKQAISAALDSGVQLSEIDKITKDQQTIKQLSVNKIPRD